MSHELSIRKDGMVEMAFAGEKPWHGLGQELQDNATIEQWQEAAGMDWRVKRGFVRYNTEPNMPVDQQQVDDQNVVLFRSDSKAPLGIVSKDFKVVQPHECLEFFRDLAEQAGYKLCTAGVLRGGRKFWAQAETGLADAVLGNDIIRARLLIATACDGSMRTVVKKVAERVVCANTLAIATKESGQEVRVSHRSKFDEQRVKAQLGIATDDFESFIAKARMLALSKITRMDADAFLLPIIGETMGMPGVVGQERKDAVRGNVGYRKIMTLFNGNGIGSELVSSNETAWGLVNAVTEYVDHHRGNAATKRDARLDYAWFGAGDSLKSEVFEKAVQAFA